MKLFELYMIAHDLLMCLSMYCIICETGVGMDNTSVIIYHRVASLSEQHMHWFTMHKAGFVTHK